MKNPDTQKAEFCEDCPMSGEIKKSFDDLYVRKLGSNEARLLLFAGNAELGTYGVLADTDRNLSEPIRVPEIVESENPKEAMRKLMDHLESDIALCDGPDTEPGIIRKKRMYIVGCHALRGLSLEETLPQNAIDALAVEHVANEIKTNVRLATYGSPKPDLDAELEEFFEN